MNSLPEPRPACTWCDGKGYVDVPLPDAHLALTERVPCGVCRPAPPRATAAAQAAWDALCAEAFAEEGNAGAE